MTVYIAGSNTTQEAQKRVAKARTYFEGQGFDVTAMADSVEDGMTREQYLQTAAEMIAEADMVCFLEGWRGCDCAQLERSICVYLDKPVRMFT